jgi:O-antigen/teichoic acid export membrane protein
LCVSRAISVRILDAIFGSLLKINQGVFKSFFDTPLWIITARIISILIGVVISILIVRNLGVETRGDVGAALGLIFGLPLLMSAGSHFFVRQAFKDNQENIVLKSIQKQILILVPANFCVSFLISAFTFSSLSELEKIFLVLGCTTSSPVIMTLAIQSYMVMKRNYLWVGISLLLPSLFTFLSVLVLLKFELLNFSSLIVSNVFSTLSTYAISICTIKIPRDTPRFLLRDLMSKSKSSGIGLIADLNNNKLDEVLIYNFFGPIIGGSYSIAISFVRAPLVLGYSLSTKYIGNLTKLSGENFRRELLVASRVTIFWSIFASLSLAIFGPVLITTLFGNEAFKASEILVYLSPMAGCMVVSILFSGTLVSVGRSGAYAFAFTTGLMTFIAVSLLIDWLDFPSVSFLAPELGSITTMILLWRALKAPLFESLPRVRDTKNYFLELLRNKGEIYE